MSELTYEKIANAIKATDYKYFGDYELSDKQREAVETLVDAAVELMSFSERSASAQQSEWIGIDDRFPELGEIVLIYQSERVFSLSNVESCQFTKYGFERSNVTHWMPLPPPPETKQ